jgi:large subunit ribosomal protein L25
MAKHILKVLKRTITGRKVKTLRRQNQTPANIFSKGLTSINITVDTKPFLKTFSIVGESTLLYLDVEGEKESRPVFIRQVVKHPVSGSVLHIAFNQVNLKEKVTAPVPLVLAGVASAEKDKLGILVQQLDEIEVTALPTDMPENISVDVSGLSEVGASITVADLKLDKKFENKTDPATIIVQIAALAKEEVAPVVVADLSAEALAKAEVPAEEGETPAKVETPAKPEEKTPEKDKKE